MPAMGWEISEDLRMESEEGGVWEGRDLCGVIHSPKQPFSSCELISVVCRLAVILGGLQILPRSWQHYDCKT